MQNVLNKGGGGLLIDDLLRHRVVEDVIVDIATELIATAAALVKQNGRVRCHLDAGDIVRIEHRADSDGDL